jgi:hypothetical protein
MSTPDEDARRDDLTWDELDDMVAEADAELLDYVRRHTDPAALLRIVASRGGDAADSATVGRSPGNGALAAVVITVRARVADLLRIVDLERARAHAHTRTGTIDLVRTHDLLRAIGRARVHVRTLAHEITAATAVAGEVDLALTLARHLDGAHGHDVALGAERAETLGTAFAQVLELSGELNAVRVDASGADLSGLDLGDLDVLVNVVWTEGTTWPPGKVEQVRVRSTEIGPGVYLVEDNTEHSPAGVGV